MSDIEKVEGSASETPEVVSRAFDGKEGEATQAFKEALDKSVEENKAPPAPVEPPRVFSETEKQAMAQGWRPKEEFDDASGKEFVSAGEFLRRGELFEKIDSQKHKIQKLEKMFEELGTHVKSVKEEAYKKAISDLETQRLQAIREGDEKQTLAIEQKQIAEQQKLIDLQKLELSKEQDTDTKADSKSIEPVNKLKPEDEQAAKSFMDRNSFWFNNTSSDNVMMVNFAMTAENMLAHTNPELTAAQRLERVEADIRKRFPEKFENSRRNDPSPVVTKSTTTASKSSNRLSHRLTPQQKSMAENLVKLKAYSSLDEYAQDLELRGQLRHE